MIRAGRLITFALLPLMLISVSGCVAIGVEKVGVEKSKIREAEINRVVVDYQAEDNSFVFLVNRTNSIRLAAPSTNDIVAILGRPSTTGPNYLRYRLNHSSWHGIAVDFAIFPIPLTIPLMVPGGKGGCVDIVFDQKGTNLVKYVTASKFYGYGSADNESGFYAGSQSGFWFNPD